MVDINRMQQWHTAVDILNGVASVLAVPTVSALLAYGAVTYTQRRRNGPELRIRQLFSLADRGWTDLPILWEAATSPDEGRASPYLWFGAALVLLTSIQPPLRELLVQDESKTVVTCNDQPVVISNDDPSCDVMGLDSKVVGLDPEPQYLELCPQNTVIQRTLDKTLDAREWDVQQHLWREVTEGENFPVQDQYLSSFSYYYDNFLPDRPGRERGTYFASSVLNGTTTGVLREHAIRMDTSVECVADMDLPEVCPGERPFTTQFTHSVLDVKICAEGRYDRFPWNMTRGKQNLSERVWLHVQVDLSALADMDEDGSDLRLVDNFTLRSDGTSRRGWFELGNDQNGYTHQPMLEKWHSPEAMQEEFNDISSSLGKTYWPVDEEPPNEYSFTPFEYDRTLDPFETYTLTTPGPLMSAALALFGNGTLLHTAREANTTDEAQYTAAMSICEHARVPYYLYDPGFEPSYNLFGQCNRPPGERTRRSIMLVEFIGGFMSMLSTPTRAQQLLEMTAFFANEALLVTSAQLSGEHARRIYSSPGYGILKPRLSVPAIGVVSVLIAAQVVGLVLLIRFIYSVPAWTAMLDALALANIGAQLSSRGLELDGYHVSGVVGMGEEGVGEGVRKRGRILAVGEKEIVSSECAG